MLVHLKGSPRPPDNGLCYYLFLVCSLPGRSSPPFATLSVRWGPISCWRLQKLVYKTGTQLFSVYQSRPYPCPPHIDAVPREEWRYFELEGYQGRLNPL